MKCFKLLLVILILLTITTPTNAQKKGDMYTGGKLGLSFYSFDGEALTGFAIAPEFGYFITDKIKIGTELQYSYSDEIHTLLFIPNIAYNLQIYKNLIFTPQVGICGGFGNDNGMTLGVIGFSLNLAAFEYRPTDKIGIAFSLVNLNYQYIDGAHYTNFNLSAAPAIGFRYYF